MDHTPRDPGGYVLGGALVLVLLGLALPVATLRTTAGFAESGWFGATTLVGSGSPVDVPVTAFGWVVVVGMVGLAAASYPRRRARTTSALVWTASAWIAAAGVGAALETTARADRMSSVLAPVLGVEATVTGSWGPWLVIGAAALAAGSTLLHPPPSHGFIRRQPRVEGVRVWRMEG